jgi:FixJ family two-component response regulator
MTDNCLLITELKPTIFIIDDDASVRKGLSRLLRSLGFEVEIFASAEQFLERGSYKGIGCIVLDVRMPGLSGMDLQDELNRAGHSLPIVFITGHGEIPMSVQAMKRGAVDFLSKPFDDKELLRAVNEAVATARRTETQRADTGDALRRVELLTPREREILRYVISGLLNKQIAFKLNIAEKTVKVHRGHIMEKLRVGSVAELVRLAEKAGIKPPDNLGNQ